MGFGAPPAIPATGGRYLRPVTLVVAASDSKDKIDVDYVCDGTDDQVEINAAIAALPAAGGSVVLREGTYTIAAAIVINRDDVMLVGSGHGTLIQVSANVNMIQVGDGASARMNVIIKDLQVDGSAATGPANNGIFFRGGAGNLITHSRVEGCYAHGNWNNGIYLSRSEDCMVVRNRVESIRSFASGIFIYQSNRNQVALNDCDNCNGSAIEADLGDQNIISNNKCSSSLDGIEVEGGNHNMVVGNYCRGNTARGIEVFDSSRYNLVIGNYCEENGIGIEVRNLSDRNIVIDNYCEDNGTGIRVSDATSDGNYVMGNYLWNNTTTFTDTGTDTELPEVMVPIFDDSDANASLSNIGDHVSIAMADTFDVTVRFNFRVPSDFHALVRARIVVVPLGTGDLRRGVETDWGACGEVYNTGSDSIAAGQVAVTLNEMECLDIDAALTGIAAGDHVGVAFTRYGSDPLDTVDAAVHVIMFWMQYV